MSIENISKGVAGKCISGVTRPDEKSVAIHLTDGTTLLVKRLREGLTTAIASPSAAPGLQPTLRQSEYLDFIKKYIARFGVSPAESDIQRHFMVSGPSAHQMVVTLERLGFISREMGVPRSIRIIEPGFGRPGDWWP
jgi:repressor LexA